MQCNGIIAVLLPINSAMIESLNGNKSFKNIYKDEKELRNSVYVVFYVHKYAPAMCNSPLYLSCHQDIPKLDIFWPKDYDSFGIFHKRIFVYEL